MGFWVVDIRQEGRGQRSAPQKTHGTPEKARGFYPENRAAGMAIRHTPHLGATVLAKHLVA